MKTLLKVKDYIGKKICESKTFECLYNTGIDYFGKHDYQNALKYFKWATEKKGIKPQVYYNLALTYQCTKEYDRAIVNYNKFLESSPKDHDGLYNLALVYYLKENYAKSVEFFEKCIKVERDEDSIKALTLAYLNNNEVEKAIKFSNEILELPDEGERLYYVVAKAFENKNNLNKDFKYIDKAIEMYSKLLEKNPKNFDAYLSISISHAKKGEWEESIDYCKKAIDVNPASYEANNQMGIVYYCCNQVKDSIDYYEKALDLKPEGDYKIYSNLGYAYEKIGEIDKAVKIFSKLVQKFPNIPAKDEIKNHLRILKTL